MEQPTAHSAERDLEVLKRARETWQSEDDYRRALDNAARRIIVIGKALACGFTPTACPEKGRPDPADVHETILELAAISQYTPKPGVHYLVQYCPHTQDYQVASVDGTPLLRITHVIGYIARNGTLAGELAFILEAVRLFGCLNHASMRIEESSNYLIERGFIADMPMTAECFTFQQCGDEQYTPAIMQVGDKTTLVRIAN